MGKRNHLLTKALLLSAFLTGCNGETNYIEDHSVYGGDAVYDVFDNEAITKGIWVTPPDKYRTEDMFQKMAEAGINMVNGFMYAENTEEEIHTVMNYCDKYGIQYLVNSALITDGISLYAQDQDPSHIQEAMDFLDKFSSHPSFAGVLLLDEPGGSLFSAIGAYAAAFRERFPDKIANVNLFPDYALGGTGFSRYEDYITHYLDATKAKVLSYDSYPLYEVDTTSENYIFEDDNYYACLDLLRQLSLDEGVPLWSFIATMGYVHPTERTRRTPSRADLRWTIFSNLAFGVKGLQYFCYCTPDQDTYGEAMINRGGETTDVYYYVKEANEEISNYEKILLNSDCVGMMLRDYRRYGQSLHSTGLTRFGPIKGIEGDHYLAGCFIGKDNGKKSVYLTPTSPRESIHIELKTYPNITQVAAYVKGQPTTITATNNAFVLDIEAGESVLLCFE
ncbi:MAG: hypothetical protein SPG64_05860 [Candidatus Enteromonas sp.]|nr:hypothetical protein [Candidatus Enteromonas sp.]